MRTASSASARSPASPRDDRARRLEEHGESGADRACPRPASSRCAPCGPAGRAPGSHRREAPSGRARSVPTRGSRARGGPWRRPGRRRSAGRELASAVVLDADREPSGRRAPARELDARSRAVGRGRELEGAVNVDTRSSGKAPRRTRPERARGPFGVREVTVTGVPCPRRRSRQSHLDPDVELGGSWARVERRGREREENEHEHDAEVTGHAGTSARRGARGGTWSRREAVASSVGRYFQRRTSRARRRGGRGPGSRSPRRTSG